MSEELFDIAVVGAGFGGIYAAHRLSQAGHSVVGIEGAPDIGGTWYHNGYPGSRVDTDSVDLYSYLFSREVYRGWRWSERYAAQPEIMAYIGWVADQLDVRRLFRFDSWLRQSRWSEDDRRWHLETSQGQRIACRFLVMCTGNLSEPKPIPWPGLDRFQGEWYQTNRWPHRAIDFKNKRVAVVGTGSSGVQAVPVIAQQAARLTVFQRSPHYGVPAVNGPANDEKYRWICDNLEEFKETMLARPTLPWGQDDRKRAAEYTPEEQRARMEAQWAFGGHGMAYVFEDIGHDWASNKVASDFVCDKIRAQIDDPVLAERCARTIPLAPGG